MERKNFSLKRKSHFQDVIRNFKLFSFFKKSFFMTVFEKKTLRQFPQTRIRVFKFHIKLIIGKIKEIK